LERPGPPRLVASRAERSQGRHAATLASDREAICPQRGSGEGSGEPCGSPDVRAGHQTCAVAAIAELAEDRVVEGVYAVARKERLRTRSGSPYLALELVDASGRIGARVWSDVELLDGRFGEGDAIRVVGRVERFRDRLQVDVRSLGRAADANPADLAPTVRRDRDELDGFLEFLAGELSHPGLRETVGRFLADTRFRDGLRSLPAAPGEHHDYAGGLLEHTV